MSPKGVLSMLKTIDMYVHVHILPFLPTKENMCGCGLHLVSFPYEWNLKSFITSSYEFPFYR